MGGLKRVQGPFSWGFFLHLRKELQTGISNGETGGKKGETKGIESVQRMNMKDKRNQLALCYLGSWKCASQGNPSVRCLKIRERTGVSMGYRVERKSGCKSTHVDMLVLMWLFLGQLPEILNKRNISVANHSHRHLPSQSKDQPGINS